MVGGDLVDELPDDHLVLCIVAEDSDVDFVTKTFAFKKLRLLDMDAQVVQTFFYISHTAPPFQKQLKAGRIISSLLLLIAFSRMGFSHTGFK